ncbi:sodium/glutamate symporter [Prochlorococcus marinus]|uniref:sodium/glutamate symporter n=1 Tax=Prochlorococcus marinus TaxID=1219 RepID=UPI0022B4691E|nr:sodium:solute symporter [Prochlorococcus marinus]
MSQLIFGFEDLYKINAIPTLVLSIGLLGIIGILLTLGRRLDSAMKLERFGIPIALLVGAIGFLIGPYGPFSLLPERVLDTWMKLPTPLLTLVFATLMLGRPIPRVGGLWKPVASQALLGLLLGFGQYVVGGVIVLSFLLPHLGVDPLMGCIIEVGFEGGHGAAAIMGDSFRKLGFPEGLDLGFAMATVGLLASTLLGSGLVVIGRFLGWLVPADKLINNDLNDVDMEFKPLEQFRLLLCNFALAGFAVLIGIFLLYCFRLSSIYVGDISKQVILAFPVFPLALMGSFFVRFIIEKTENTQLVSSLFQREIGILSTDLLIITAMAGLNLPLLVNYWVPISILAIGGLVWNLAGMLIFSRLFFSEEWFERAIAEFGNSTGVAASGLLLLRLADPRNSTNTLPVFSVKQLFLQPLLSGGLITVIAPLFISNFGLKGWTVFCGLISLFLCVLAISLQSKYTKAFNTN